MAVLRSKSALFWFLLVVTAHVITAAGITRRRVILTKNEAETFSFSFDLRNNTLSFGSRKPSSSGITTGPEPGDPADAFRVPTLDGEFSYQPGALLGRGSIMIHAFTSKSGFLECLWSSESSLSSLVRDLPDSAQVLFLSLDDSAVSDALWMREQLHRAAAHSKKEVLSRLHFSPVPVFTLGNWIPSVLYSWGCMDHNCGLSQVVFTSNSKNL
ncbi:hypothetical protein LDENG_00239140 [Lucifuga dentata]|nr:hypothetical protein LDENG_00239140 [Lucifuga dentata]